MLLLGERIEIEKVLPELGIGEVRKMVPDGVGGAAAVSAPKIEPIRELVPFCPPGPASFVTGSGPYQYTVHVKQNAGHLNLNHGGISGNGSRSRVHKSEGISLRLPLRMLVGPQLGLPGSDAGAIQIRESQLPFLDQLGRLAVPFLGAGKHPFRTGALSIWRSANLHLPSHKPPLFCRSIADPDLVAGEKTEGRNDQSRSRKR